MLIDWEALHVFPRDGQFVLYNSRSQAVALVDGSGLAVLKRALDHPEQAEQYADFLGRLRTLGIVADQLCEDRQSHAAGKSRGFFPISVALFPSNNCNLRCVYCYSSASSGRPVMSSAIAEAAIRYAQENAAEVRDSSGDLCLHGGGEPFFGEAWKLTKHAVEFANDNAAKLGINWSCSASSNGMLARAQLKWIVANQVRMQISFDGPRTIQDANRPAANGASSFRSALRTIEFFEQVGHKYAIRTTLTGGSIGRLHEIIDFFASVSSIDQLHVEPVFECGRCETSHARAPEAKYFADAMADGEAYAATKGLKLYFSQCDLKGRARFCGALAGR